MADPGFSQGAPTFGAGGAGIKFNFFLRTLYEIEKNLAARGGRGPGRLDPPLDCSRLNLTGTYISVTDPGFPRIPHTRMTQNPSFDNFLQKKKPAENERSSV